MRRETPRARGRPPSESGGAQDAFDLVERYRKRENLSVNGLALRCGMTPSTVSRTLASRESARWTPALKRLYRIAENGNADPKLSSAMQRLAGYDGPGEATVKRLMNDIEELIRTLSSRR